MCYEDEKIRTGMSVCGNPDERSEHSVLLLYDEDGIRFYLAMDSSQKSTVFRDQIPYEDVFIAGGSQRS